MCAECGYRFGEGRRVIILKDFVPILKTKGELAMIWWTWILIAVAVVLIGVLFWLRTRR